MQDSMYQETIELIDGFTQALNILQEWDQMCFNYWREYLFDDEYNWKFDKFTSYNLKKIQQDMMNCTENVLLG